MTGELHVTELTRVNDGLLDSQAGKEKTGLQSQWELIRDGLVQGMSGRVQEAKDNSLQTTVEVAGSFALGAALAQAMKAGGRWGLAAKGAGALFGALAVNDVAQRGMAINDAYSNSSGDTLAGQQLRKDAIAKYAGSGIVDYSVMLASGGLGAASVHMAPRISAKLNTALEPLGKFGAPEPALQPIRISSMDLGERGRLGARERVSSPVDPVEAARARLEEPHRTVGLDGLSDLLKAKQVAAHPEIRPLYEQLSEGLSKADRVKPLLARDESALASLDKQMSDIKSLKPETQAVKTAEASLTGLRADMERLPALREEHARLSKQIADLKKPEESGAEVKKNSKDKAPAVNVEELKANRRDLNETINSISARQKDLPTLEEKLSAAREQLAQRKAAIDSGKDQSIKALEEQMKPLRESAAARRSELDSIGAQLKGINDQIQAKTDALLPNLTADSPLTVASVPKYERPKIELPKSERPSTAKKAEHAESPLDTETQARRPEARVEQPRQQPERMDSRSGEANVRRVGEADVNKAFAEAQNSVEDFASTHKRHTTALKKVHDYIDTSFSWFGSDAQAAANSGKVSANVEAMLSKLENWDSAPNWIRGADRAQLMQRNGFDAATMDKFDNWFQTQNKAYTENGNSMPDRKLLEIKEHLSRRVAVESVKNWLRTNADVEKAVSPIVNEGFQMVASGKLPDGKPIPNGSDMIVFEKRSVKGANGSEDAILPFAKDGQHMQRFDDSKIVEGLRKLEAMKAGGPLSLPAQELYGFRLNHDPSRLLASGDQVGFAILRPGGQYGKNIMYMQFTDDSLIPKSLRQDSPNGPGTNTGVLYNMLRNAGRAPKPEQ